MVRHASDVQISSHSPKPFAKLRRNPMNRGMSNPEINPADLAKIKENKERGRVGSLFQKKKKHAGYSNLSVFEEEAVSNESERTSPIDSPTKQLSKPLYKPRKSSGSTNLPTPKPLIPRVIVDGESGQVSPRSASPKESDKQPVPSPKGNMGGAKKRQPPPRPAPYAKTHPTQAAKLDMIIKAHKQIDNPDTETVKVNGGSDEKENSTNLSQMSKESSSMEDMLKNLQDFEEAEFIERSNSVSSNRTPSIEYETFERPKTPPTDEVVTIKVSEYKPSSDTEDDEDGEEEEQDGGGEEDKPIEMKNEKLFSQDEEWNPREWMPSPEPVVKSNRHQNSRPSFSIEVNSKQQGNGHAPSSNSGSVGESKNQPPVKKKPLPPPKVMSRPRRSFSNSPKTTPSGSPMLASRGGSFFICCSHQTTSSSSTTEEERYCWLFW